MSIAMQSWRSNLMLFCRITRCRVLTPAKRFAFAERNLEILRLFLCQAQPLTNLQQPAFAKVRTIIYQNPTSITRLDNILVRLLDQARNAHTEVERKKIDWTNLIDEVLHDLAYLDPEDKVNKFIHLETETEFWSDSSRIESILTHVVGNTFVHRSTGKHHESIISIDVFTSPESAVIVVKDNGKGIPPEYIPNVFDMFFKGDSSSPGAGLGLSLAKEIATKLNGTIDITSRQNMGTTVRIELPNKSV